METVNFNIHEGMTSSMTVLTELNWFQILKTSKFKVIY